MFWISTLLLLLTGIAFVLVPVFLMRNTAESENGQRVAANIALYRERSRELIDELNSGALDRAGYDSLLAELQRSLLSDTGPGEAGGANVSRGMSGSEGPAMPLSKQVRNLLTAGPSAARPGTGLLQPVKLIPLIAVLLIPPVAYGLYEKWGYHDDIQLSGLFRQALHPSNDPKEVSALIMALKSAVQEYPDNQWAWYFLGRSYSRLGMHKLASDAYLSALSYLDNEPDRVMAMSQYVLAEFQGADRQLTESARNMAARVLAINPDEQTVLRVLATEARERDDLATAIEYWRRLVRASPASSAARVYRSNIAAAENMLRDRGELPSTTGQP